MRDFIWCVPFDSLPASSPAGFSGLWYPSVLWQDLIVFQFRCERELTWISHLASCIKLLLRIPVPSTPASPSEVSTIQVEELIL